MKEVLKIFQKNIERNKDAFAASKTHLGTCSYIKHSIDTAGAAPVCQPLRRTPTRFETEEEKNLKDQLEQGVIRPSTSLLASNVVLVRKKDQTVRWCCDFRRLNELTVKCAYPVPRIDMYIDCLSSASIFSCIDLQSGYWQLKVEEKDIPKTAFITKYGLFEYTKMPFGLCNAPATFQCCMELILRGLQWQTVLIYLDHVIIYSFNIDEHFKHLNEVLTRLKNAGLKLKSSK
ncbi:Transposon Ty3-G Gag-Pol polyprotein,Transposon Ty3-I Gag-Pol polyprotein,Retrovirus-related Pol polyprotein from transposon 297,Retrovirus-related Pol polyprotein from transposon 17.6 [Mytilus coruscus]|uniref:Transposon Ty3-G Gag-Pol polyprotein,Transposon Ty3-I Gag-Pol polyprotein,Retrovirus-related Pol polyprotein from transposon 297,Retrovirus-related Pol polyprotein from transposon 17.6 n=1 Tax=Mytilus coruscus TaxID=42192 RepID=A0A6J8DKX6_MYTCO|nr:Transposon Ty3-G Gag-Pol polyprotein,Transposon Ty3-I Gag-Pol polyprotein,Retrovirus-related Pol polyprotein from transposon 297,Retrovirus-related Pol polyprotein from transposon 17.6 [Mytilus coruscus]